jgi:hypothetical protein
LFSTGPNAALESKSNGDASTLNSASLDLEFIKSVPATSSAAKAVTANPEQTIEIKKENEQKVDLVATNSNSSSVDPKVKPVKQFILKPAADIPLKDLKKA